MSEPPPSAGRAVRCRAETVKAVASTCGEVLKTVGIVASLLLAWWANCTKADNEKVKLATEQTDAALETLSESVDTQHAQTEKIRESMEGTAKAVRAIASTPVTFEVPDKEPDGSGCWTLYGGIVRCKKTRGVAPLLSSPKPKVELPPVPPPVPAPKMVEIPRGKF